ncbi:nucleoside phosphatase GDA1/CD39, partial [Syncephalis pseudoplumigaleata]
IVIDAGSSGSRVHVYSWRAPETQRALLTAAEWTRLPVMSITTMTTGLSTFADRSQSVHEHLTPLTDFAKGIIPADAWARTQVYLLATAGMRLVPAPQQAQVLEAACRHFRDSSPFSVASCDKQIRVISGEMEGVYGWVTVNYLLGGFEKALPSSSIEFEEQLWPDAMLSAPRPAAKQDGGRGRTLGFSDMGGASTQLVFEPSTQVADEHRHDMTEVRLRRLDGSVARHDVFVATFLGFGTNQARQRHLARLQAQSNGGALVDHCLPTGAHEQLAGGVRATGGGSFARCREHTLPLLNKTAVCPEEPCLFNGVHTPEIDYAVHRFVGVSDWWYAMHDILGLGGDYDAHTFEQAAHRYCQLDWEQLVAEHRAGRFPPGVDEERLRVQCFKAAWLANILHEGFGLPRTDATLSAGARAHFQSLDNANGIPFSWTLGAAMMHAVSPVEIG